MLRHKYPENAVVLLGHLLKNITVKIDSICLTQCFKEANCMSFNLGPLVDGNHECELSNSDHVMHPNDLEHRAGFVYQSFEVSSTVKLPLFITGKTDGD